MKVHIVLTGGGSAGHVTPLKALAGELKRQIPGCELTFVAQENDQFAQVIEAGKDVDTVISIRAGKYRRYPNESTLKRLFDARTHALNGRDMLLNLRATWQSYRYLQKARPDAVLGKGGFVSVPVGLAAHRLGIPLVIHESDSRLGLANRIL